AFRYLMWCKLNLFKDKADALFKDERLSQYIRQNSPLRLMPDSFTYEQFCTMCVKLCCRKKPNLILNNYVMRGKVERVDDNNFRKLK
ncbi:MAG: hypothetical protein HUK02_10265, partial [Bacteroidaceae bacterium]|nr:hypothetical protein [Bacteroidaceae bacterium]